MSPYFTDEEMEVQKSSWLTGKWQSREELNSSLSGLKDYIPNLS